ncbi:MAG: RING finger protein [Nitrosotalea sp.]
MPLSENSLVLLNQIASIDCKGTLDREQDELIKNTFEKILSSGNIYKIDEIEKWLEATNTNPVVSERILNVAHYQKAKHDAKNPLKMAHDDSCGCGGDC